MGLVQRSLSSTVRKRVREFIRTFSGEPPTPEETRVRLEFVLRARSEVAAGSGDLIRMLAPAAAADALGDPERIAAYAETLAAEAMINQVAGHVERADAIRQLAVALAREAQHRARAPDDEIDRLIARDGRLED
jgi:hypothetical protein